MTPDRLQEIKECYRQDSSYSAAIVLDLIKALEEAWSDLEYEKRYSGDGSQTEGCRCE